MLLSDTGWGPADCAPGHRGGAVYLHAGRYEKYNLAEFCSV